MTACYKSVMIFLTKYPCYILELKNLHKTVSYLDFSAVDNFLWMVYSTHHVGEIWCTQKSECVPVRLSCEN